MKNRRLIAVAMVMLTGCARAPSDSRGVDRGETLLTVSGTGRAEAVPDQALFIAGLSSIAPSAEAASARNAETMNSITAALAKLNVPTRDIQTRDLSVNRIGYGPNRGQFEATNQVAVRLRDTGKVGAAIASVTAAGANIVSGPNLSVANPERANLNAYGLAYKAARAKAEAYAAAAGLRVARVLAIYDGGQGGVMQPMEEGDALMIAPQPVAVQAVAAPVLAGTSANTVAVRVDFALAAK